MLTDICPVKDAKDKTKLTNMEGLQPPASHGRCDSRLIMKAKHPGETQEYLLQLPASLLHQPSSKGCSSWPQAKTDHSSSQRKSSAPTPIPAVTQHCPPFTGKAS